MSDGRTLAPHRPELVVEDPAPTRPHWLGMVMSSDHKDVGRVYIGASLGFLVLGIVAFLLMRLQLAVPENNLIAPVTFNRVLSVGSATLIVLFALPFVFGLFTYVVPLQIRSSVAGLPAARLALAVALRGRRRPALRELRVHASQAGFQSLAPALRHESSSRTTGSTSGSPRSG